jgi:metal-sulfur cluster biosynthetic enzyme
MKIQEEQLLKELNKVRHPETRQGIVELGMVKEITYREGNLWISLQFSKPNDPFVQSIQKACVRVVDQAFGEGTLSRDRIQVTVPEPPVKPEVLHPH